MAGFGMVLGGALSGLGRGMAQDAATKIEIAHREAMENLRHRNSLAAQQQTADLNDRNSARATERDTSARLTLKSADQQHSLAMAERGAAGQAAEGAARREHDVTMERLRQGFQANQAEADRAFQREKEWGKPIGSHVDEETGDVTYIYRGGKTEKYGGIARQAPKAGGSSLLATMGQQTPASAPKEATRAQLEEMAKSTGQSLEAAEAWARAAGFTIR